MGRKAKRSSAPIWAYEDNPYSPFGMIYADMLKSKKYQGLSCSAKQFLTVCMVHSNTEKAKECLYNALRERYNALNPNVDDYQIKQEVYDKGKGLFVFPKKQYEEYGYTKGYIAKLLKELKDNGFIGVKQYGKNAYKVNIYYFSTEWKKQK